MGFERISIDPGQMGGVPCLRGLRIPVVTVVGLVAQGMTEARLSPRLAEGLRAAGHDA